MKSMTYGTLPDLVDIPNEPYPIGCNQPTLDIVAAIVNQGIDSHLEAVITEREGDTIIIKDAQSLRTFIRRCIESDDEDTLDLASSICTTIDIEWV
jgi:hypothetical protein